MQNLQPATILGGWLTDRPAAPLITFYGADGVRIELSGATTANAVCKAVNLFRYELGLEPGDTVWLDLPCHWQVPVLALAVWGAGLTLAIGEKPQPAAAATLGTGTGAAGGEAWAVSLHPWGLPLGADTPAGWEDFAAVARVQPDQAQFDWPSAADVWLEPGDGSPPLTGTDLLQVAAGLGRAWGLPAGGRLLSTLPPSRAAGLLACTVVPAMARGGVILATSAATGAILRQEGNAPTAFDV